jgi:hypothetical protein
MLPPSSEWKTLAIITTVWSITFSTNVTFFGNVQSRVTKRKLFNASKSLWPRRSGITIMASTLAQGTDVPKFSCSIFMRACMRQHRALRRSSMKSVIPTRDFKSCSKSNQASRDYAEVQTRTTKTEGNNTILHSHRRETSNLTTPVQFC